MTKPKIFPMPFARVCPLYVEKAKKKGRTRQEVDEIIFCLTGYDDNALQQVIENETGARKPFSAMPYKSIPTPH